MNRYFALFTILLALSSFGCSSSSSDAPADTQAHPEGWISTHPEEALASENYTDCINCHGTDLNGSDTVIGCDSCHSYNTDPPFSTHPEEWTNAYTDHRAYCAANGTVSCASCHGSDLQGSEAAPSCFSASIDGLSCHTDGPRLVPHAVDDEHSYLSGENHGPDAKQDLTACQVCHGQSGAAGSNPRFNIGIYSIDGTGCEACHGINMAHPADWPGLDHASAENIGNACTLCHGINLDGDGTGVSCLTCHVTSPADNPSGCASCHGQPPTGELPVGDISPNRVGQHDIAAHTIGISAVPSETCGRCHAGAGSGTTNHFDETNPADVTIYHPDAIDTMEATSTPTNTTCTGVCHFSGIEWSHDNKSWY